MKITIIANPAAGRGRAYTILHRLTRHWPYNDWEYEFLSTRRPHDAGALAMEQLSNPPDVLAVCGGDGTLHEVATRVPDPPFPVALLPAGTANVLARDLGVPLNPRLALEVALKRVVRRVDLGSLDARATCPFLLMAGVGLDAYVASKVRPAVKKRLGIFAYVVSTLHSLATYPFREFQVSIGGQQFTATSCLIANTKGYGGGLVFTPTADMSDGLFDVLMLEGRPRLDYLRFLWNAWRGRAEAYPWVRHLRTSVLKVIGPRELLVQADGELIGTLPIEIGIKAQAFPLVVPGGVT